LNYHKRQYDHFLDDCLPNYESLFHRKQFPYNIPGWIGPRHNDPEQRMKLEAIPDKEKGYRPYGSLDPNARPIDDCIPFFSLLVDPDAIEKEGQCEILINKDDEWISRHCHEDRSESESIEGSQYYKCTESAFYGEECYWCSSKFIDLRFDSFDMLCDTIRYKVPLTGGGIHDFGTLRDNGNLICEFIDLYKYLPPPPVAATTEPKSDDLDDLEYNEEPMERMNVLLYSTNNSYDNYIDQQFDHLNISTMDASAKYWDRYFDLKYVLYFILLICIYMTTVSEIFQHGFLGNGQSVELDC